MYVTEVSVRIEAGREEEARLGLVNQVLPMVKGSPGFVAGYWFAPDGDKGASVVFWETRQHAEAMAAQLRPGAHPAPPVTVERVEVREVIASI
jgi:heme-degrading monooxygenase HmoA